ncbi:hypothetical protein PanWU01x14_247810, partial [Parasponia andersonii]
PRERNQTQNQNLIIFSEREKTVSEIQSFWETRNRPKLKLYLKKKKKKREKSVGWEGIHSSISCSCSCTFEDSQLGPEQS